MITILIVEDDPEQRDMLARRLQRRGFAIIEAADGLTSAKLSENHLPDVILMDLQMPSPDGWETTLLIRQNPKTAHIPIIAVTGMVSLQDRELCIKAGIAAFITKPLHFETLIDQIAFVLTPRKHTTAEDKIHGAADPYYR